MGRGTGQWAGLLPDYTWLSLYSLRREQWMNVRVGDIIKLENNQFVAVSAALRQVWFQQGGWHTGTRAVVPLPLCFYASQGGDIRNFQPGSCMLHLGWRVGTMVEPCFEF